MDCGGLVGCSTSEPVLFTVLDRVSITVDCTQEKEEKEEKKKDKAVAERCIGLRGSRKLTVLQAQVCTIHSRVSCRSYMQQLLKVLFEVLKFAMLVHECEMFVRVDAGFNVYDRYMLQ